MTLLETLDPALLLGMFALAWVLIAGLLGLMQGVKHTRYLASLDDCAGRGDLAGYHREFIAFRQATNAHTHAMLFALLSLAIALFIGQSGAPRGMVTMTVSLLIGATVIWTIGGVLDIKAVKGAGDLMLLAGVATALLQALEMTQ